MITVNKNATARYNQFLFFFFLGKPSPKLDPMATFLSGLRVLHQVRNFPSFLSDFIPPPVVCTDALATPPSITFFG